MIEQIKKFVTSSWQTKLFIFMLLLYMVALAWTTVQSYVRLAYNRSDWPEETHIKTESSK